MLIVPKHPMGTPVGTAKNLGAIKVSGAAVPTVPIKIPNDIMTLYIPIRNRHIYTRVHA